jgi:REP element-mobilizing transposase RayT
MANTYTQIYIQAIFAVQDRISLIKAEWKDELYKYITGIVQNNKHKLLAINCVSNHVHIFFGYKPHQLIPDLLQDIKGSSSRWINDEGFVKGKFRWQESYGAFSYSHSQLGDVIRYIQNQEQHHRHKTFKEEYENFLKKFDISYNPKYLLEDIQ